MRTFAIRAPAGGGFRLTLDLSAWAAVGVSLAPATLRLQALTEDGSAALEIATGAANPAVFDPLTGLAVFSAPAAAIAGLAGVYRMAARAEFAAFEIPLFGGSLTFFAAAATRASAGLPTADTAYIAAQPFGPAPVPAALASAVQSAQQAARDAFTRSFVYGGN